MSGSNEKKERIKIGFGTSFNKLNLNKKIDFSGGISNNNFAKSTDNNFSKFSNANSSYKFDDVFKNNNANTSNNNSNLENSDNSNKNFFNQNQFRKVDFSNLSKNINKDNLNENDSKNINKNNKQNEKAENEIDKTSPNNNTVQKKEQFRKPVFAFEDSGGKKDQKEDKFSSSKQDDYKKQNYKNNNFNHKKDFTNIKNDNNKNYVNKNNFGDKTNKFNNDNKEIKQGVFNKDRKPFNDFEKKITNSFNKNFGNKFGKNNFFKKNNQVKVKLKEGINKDNGEQKSFKKSSNTGSNVDKYSINGMIKTISNNIDLDTEIDDILGNVISVKLSGINSANSLQKERKIRTSTNSDKKINFNIPIVREVEVFNDKINLSQFANQMAISTKDLIKVLQKEGIEIDNSDIDNFELDGDTAELVAQELGHKIVRKADDDVENEFINKIKGNRKDLKPRAPVVTIMGHVDHGKTTLLDYIRKTSVASGEAGGITQHIGAYRTKVKDRFITFLDTPGHAAFTQMRMRGAKCTDIVVIVIAGDDGIMPQTIEAINHAKTAQVPIIVAINKIDKPEANIERSKQMLLQYEVIPEDLGGDVMVVPISAKNGTNVDKLLEAILLQADILELKAYYDGGADGFVIESKLDKKRGTLVTVIVNNGILSQGDFIIAGEQYGKIKGMFDENGKMVKTAEPSVPVEILGLNSTPNAGEVFYAVKNEKDAKEFIEYRKTKAKEDEQKNKDGLNKNYILSKMNGESDKKTLSFIIKADTNGSVEAIVNTIEKLENDEVKIKVSHKGVGSVSENDVLLASSCNGFILTFNTQKCDKKVLELAEKNGVEIRDYKIIYEMFDDIDKIINGKLEPIQKKDILGNCEVKIIFEISKVGKIAGCLVKDGLISRGANVSVIRNGETIFETKCISLKHGKENVKEVKNGQECGVGLEKIDEIQQGDILEFFVIKEEKK